MIIKVTRHTQTKTKSGGMYQTLGDLEVIDGGKVVFKCKTLELPWLDNKKSVSCIPPGPGGSEEYEWVKLNSSPSFSYAHLWIKDVPNRTGIKVHIANYAHQLRGCISVGKQFAYVDKDDQLDLTSSRDTMTALMKVLPEKGKIVIESKIPKGVYVQCESCAELRVETLLNPPLEPND